MTKEKIKELHETVDRLMQQATLEEKCAYLEERFALRPPYESVQKRWIYDQLASIGQAEHVLGKGDEAEALLKTLQRTDTFYAPIGGLLGYHLHFLQLLKEGSHKKTQLLSPPQVNLDQELQKKARFIQIAVRRINEFAEIYPVGGAGERLDLRDKETKENLPVAYLPFFGRSLLEGIFRDLTGREYLAWKIEGRQVVTPVALMTSDLHQNHEKILDLLERNKRYGRPREKVRLFKQPMAPVISEKGEWIAPQVNQLEMKPCGHGAVWKSAIDEGIFTWLKSQGRHCVLVRQINNPIAGQGSNLLALAGAGTKEDLAFGFLGCEQQPGRAEGALVQASFKEGQTITNIEYTELKERGVAAEHFPANTNILFARLSAIEEALLHNPIPGKILNLKTRYGSVMGGRLESMMQNIADAMPSDPLKTFLLTQKREKTISVTKRGYRGGEITDTPFGAFYQLQKNAHALLKHIGWELPDFCTEDDYLAKGPSTLIEWLPALGPVEDVIAQKLRGKKMKDGSEMRLEIAEMDMEDVSVEGSLLIEGDAPLGDKGVEGTTNFSDRCCRCTLKNVLIRNEGLDRKANAIYWNGAVIRAEACRIILKGCSEFIAENVKFEGDFTIEVQDGTRCIAYEENGKLRFKQQSLKDPSWKWVYSFDGENRIRLKRTSLSV